MIFFHLLLSFFDFAPFIFFQKKQNVLNFMFKFDWFHFESSDIISKVLPKTFFINFYYKTPNADYGPQHAVYGPQHAHYGPQYAPRRPGSSHAEPRDQGGGGAAGDHIESK